MVIAHTRAASSLDYFLIEKRHSSSSFDTTSLPSPLARTFPIALYLSIQRVQHGICIDNCFPGSSFTPSPQHVNTQAFPPRRQHAIRLRRIQKQVQRAFTRRIAERMGELYAPHRGRRNIHCRLHHLCTLHGRRVAGWTGPLDSSNPQRAQEESYRRNTSPSARHNPSYTQTRCYGAYGCCRCDGRADPGFCRVWR